MIYSACNGSIVEMTQLMKLTIGDVYFFLESWVDKIQRESEAYKKNDTSND